MKLRTETDTVAETPPVPKKKVLDKFVDIVYVENPK